MSSPISKAAYRAFGGGDRSVDAALGLGVDLRFRVDLAVRVSGGLGDIDGVGIGLAYIH